MDSNIQANPCLDFDFVKNGYLKLLRNQAISGGEFASTELFTYAAKEFCFVGPQFSIPWEHPPGPNHRNRTDYIVRLLYILDWDPRANIHKPPEFCHIFKAEGKRAGADDGEIRTAEKQVYESCEVYAQAYELHTTWAKTYYGSKYRFWAYQVGIELLIPFYPLTNVRGSKEAYLDLAGTEAQYKRVCEYMTKNLQPDPALFNAHIAWIIGTAPGDCPVV